MTQKFEGKSGVSTMVLTREDVIEQVDDFPRAGKKSVPAVKSVLTVDIDGDRKNDVRIEAMSFGVARSFATIEYRAKGQSKFDTIDALNPNRSIANQLTAAGVSFDGSGVLDPEQTQALLKIAKDIAHRGEFEARHYGR